MPGTFHVEWLPGGVLVQTRSGLLSVEQAEQYVAAVEDAVGSAPSPWGAVIDTRSAPAQTEDVQAIIQRLIRFVEAKHVKRIAIVATSAVTGIQQRRITTAPGMHDPSNVSFHHDFDEAVAEVRAALAGS
jgi:hypothetical protein